MADAKVIPFPIEKTRRERISVNDDGTATVREYGPNRERRWQERHESAVASERAVEAWVASYGKYGHEWVTYGERDAFKQGYVAALAAVPYLTADAAAQAHRERSRLAFHFAGRFGGKLGQEQTQEILDWINEGAQYREKGTPQ